MVCRTCYTADLATFRQMFPALDTVDDATVQNNLDSAGCVLDEISWCCTLPEAQLYLAAHQIAWSQNVQASSALTKNGNVITNPVTGNLTSASDGAMSVSYGANAQATSENPFLAYYGTTPYGTYFLQLMRRQMPIGLLAVTNSFGGGNGFFFG